MELLQGLEEMNGVGGGYLPIVTLQGVASSISGKKLLRLTGVWRIFSAPPAHSCLTSKPEKLNAIEWNWSNAPKQSPPHPNLADWVSSSQTFHPPLPGSRMILSLPCQEECNEFEILVNGVYQENDECSSLLGICFLSREGPWAAVPLPLSFPSLSFRGGILCLPL